VDWTQLLATGYVNPNTVAGKTGYKWKIVPGERLLYSLSTLVRINKYRNEIIN
jgi:hypothetical protein